MEVKDRIYMPSPILKNLKETPIFTSIPYPSYIRPTWVGNKDPQGYVPPQPVPFPIKLIELWNVVVTTECVIVRWDGYHLFKRECHPRYWGLGQKYHVPQISFKKYHSVVCIGHQHSSDWGHWFLEVYPVLLVMPSDIIRNSVIALPFKRDFIIDNLEVIGISLDQIVEGDNIPLYADVLYTVKSTWCGDLNTFLLNNMRHYFVNVLGLDARPPTKFVLINRPPNMSRSIGNFNEMMDLVKSSFPMYHWEAVTMYKTVIQQALYFNQICLVFAVHGSILANEIFMQPKTVCIELQMDSWLLSFINLGPMTGKIVIEGRDSSIKYRKIQPNIVDLNYMINLIRKGLSAGNSYAPAWFPYNCSQN